MIPDNFKLLIEKLKAKTSRKEAIWSKTSRDNEFKLDLGKGAITIDNYSDDDGLNYVDMVVINDRGDIIDRIWFSRKNLFDYDELVELHNMARRAYYKVDETFKSIFKELDSDKTLGIAEPKDDDLPF